MNPVVESVRKNLDFSQNKALKELIYEGFKKTIVLGDIPAGSRINENELADILNISRTPIRFAMSKLAAERLVEHVPRIGIVVKGISIKDAHEIYAIRKSLDTLATIEAAKRMDDTDFNDLKELLEYGEKMNREDKIDDVLQNFSDFNAFIYEKSQMFRLKSIVLNLQAYLLYFRDIAIRSSDRRDRALAEHWMIFRSMQHRDEEQIQLIIHEHLDYSLNFILAEMERHKID